MTKRKCALWCLLLTTGGCARNAIHTAANQVPRNEAAPQASFLDLEAGWRLRVIVPLRKPGAKGPLITGDASVSGTTLTLRAADSFLGYETQIYDVNKDR